MKFFKARSPWIGLLALLLLSFVAPGTATAQDDESAGPTRVAVLDVPGGGTEPLLEKLGSISDLEILRQEWFIKQIQNRGFDAKGIMRRPKDLKWVMDGGDLDYVLFLAPVSEQSYEARIVGKDGEVVKKLSADRTPDGLSESGADLIRREFQDFLDANKPKVQKLGNAGGQQDQQAKTDEDEDLDPNELKARASTEKDATSKALSTNWLWATGSARFMQRGFNVVGSNEETLSYKSGFYAGAHVNVEAYPFGMTNADFQAVGLYADFRYGGDSVSVLQENDATEPVPMNISHLEFAAGVSLRGENPARDMDSDPDPHTRLNIGIRTVSMNLDPNVQLPSISHFHLTVGGKLDYPFLTDGLYASVGAEVTPVGFLQNGEELFGETSSSFGMSGELGLLYKFSDSIGISTMYDARLFRTVFEGEGTANFQNANALELVQGFSAGLQYHY
ncbi:MAG: hypothetical protein ACQEVA_03225 [Myxococcota bacterium]